MNNSQWFYRDGGKTVGPFTLEKIQDLRTYGLISDLTLIKEGESREWIEFRNLIANNRFSIKPKVDPEAISENQETNLSEIDGEINGWLINPVTPWRRYGARFLDISINGAIGAFLLGLSWYAIDSESADDFFSSLNPIADLILTTFISIIISGILTGFSGSSVGKWIFGIRVTNPDGSPIGVMNGLFRDLGVWVKGLGFGIPLINIVTLYMSYDRLRTKGSTSWDESEGYVVTHRPNGWTQYTLNTLGIFLIIIVQMLLRMSEQL